MNLLQNGQRFPYLSMPKVGGGTLDLPGALNGSYGVVLIYRGAWCSYCNAQLAAFGRAATRLEEAGIMVAAFSVDDQATTEALVSKHGLRFPVGYGANADQVVAATGAYSNNSPRFIQTTGFVLSPKGAIVNAVYSSSVIGRLTADDAIGLVNYTRASA